MFSANSPKLPIGTTFEATIEPSPKGSALSLKINPSSVRLIESVEELSSENSSAQFVTYLLKIDAELASVSSKTRVAEVIEQMVNLIHEAFLLLAAAAALIVCICQVQYQSQE
ncbi:MAG: hypothetical protein P7H58_11815 [Microcoleus anatoxicus]